MVIRKTIIYGLLALALGLAVVLYASDERRAEASSSAEVPESIILGDLAKTYEPLTFSHQMHSAIAEDCAACHHHSQAGQTPACAKCHKASTASKESGVPALKEAYHGQCIGCHRDIEMGPTGCMDCHVKRAVQAASSEKPVKVAAADGPESLTLNRLENRYESVAFSHGMHSEMTESCAACHHHSPVGQTPSCGECHGKPFDPEKLGTPGLKGAYHLQCMGCHKEMGSGPVGCTDCHAKKVAPATKTGSE
jgi:hypothetical protein